MIFELIAKQTDQLSAMNASLIIDFLRPDIEWWTIQLEKLRKIVTEWQKLQSSWKYLQPIFS
jgi:hypothetical protein